MLGLVLGFRINALKAVQIDNICRQLGLEYRNVEASDYGQPLGVLAGISGMKRQMGRNTEAVSEVQGEMLIFSGLNDKKLDEFLGAYKAAHIPVIERKAVITQYNVFMSANMLYRELEKERQAYRRV